MSRVSRRSFIGKSAIATVPVAFGAGIINAKKDEKYFLHQVYFWLKEPGNISHRDKLVEGLKKLNKIKDIKQSHIGIPANTKREVVDSTYAVSWLLFFEDQAAQDRYQVDPVHLKFIEECSPLWSKVIVYDSIDI